jgi:hypothetical protein
LLQRSEEFDNAYWTKDGATITANNTISPDGNQSADLINYTGSNNRVFTSVTKAASALTYTLNAYVKINTLDVLRLNLDGGSTANRADAIFDLPTGTLTSTAVLGTFTNQSGSIVDVGNGWYRCTLTATTGTEVSIRAQFFGKISESVYLWGAQLEVGSFASTYIQTTDATATRNADVLTVTGASGVIGQESGWIYAEVDVRNISFTNFRGCFSIRSTDNSSQVYIGRSTTGRLLTRVVVGGSNIYSENDVAPESGICSVLIVYKSGGSFVYVNGVQVSTSTESISFGSSMSIIEVGNRLAEVRYFDDPIFRTAIGKTTLTEQQAIELTTI